MSTIKRRRERRPNFIRAWREKRQMSQEDLAGRAGIAGGTLSLIESRQAGYSIETLDALAKILEITAGELLDRDPTDGIGTWALAERLKKLPADQRERLISAAEILAGRVAK